MYVLYNVNLSSRGYYVNPRGKGRAKILLDLLRRVTYLQSWRNTTYVRLSVRLPVSPKPFVLFVCSIIHPSMQSLTHRPRKSTKQRPHHMVRWLVKRVSFASSARQAPAASVQAKANIQRSSLAKFNVLSASSSASTSTSSSIGDESKP